MTKEEAKVFLGQANALINEQQYQQALDLLDQVDEAFPNSARVVQEKVTCLIGLDRLDDAEAACTRLKTLPGGEQADALMQRVTAARQREANAGTPPAAAQAPSAAAENELLVESVIGVSAEETCITGHVEAGAFFTGATITVKSPDGVPLLAPILRIGTQETPLNVVRKGSAATLILGIESQYIPIGSRLTSTTSEDAYAPTMIADDAEGQGPDAAPEAAGRVPQLQEARKALAQGGFAEAKALAESILAASPQDFEAHWLLSRVYLEAKGGLADPQRALEHIKKAYEFGGHNEPQVLDVLAHALGANGQAEHGLRHLERLYEIAPDPREKEACGKRVNAYREKYAIPDSWQFVDGFGAVVFESSDPGKILKALESKSIPENAMCRRNKTGKLMPIEESVAKAYPQIAALYEKSAGNKLILPAIIAILIAAIIIAVLWAFI